MTIPAKKQREDSPLYSAGNLQWVRVSDIHVNPLAQRGLNGKKAAAIAADFDVDILGYPVLNQRAGQYWCVDGQTRVEALKIMGWEDQYVECEVFKDLEEKREAELFLTRNNFVQVSEIAKFWVAAHTAMREPTVTILRAIQEEGMDVPKSTGVWKSGIKVQCVGAVREVYAMGGYALLRRTLGLLKDSFGDDQRAYQAPFVMGMGLLLNRYGKQATDKFIAKQLGNLPKGAQTVVTKRNLFRDVTERPVYDCMAAALTELASSSRGQHRLPKWWGKTLLD